MGAVVEAALPSGLEDFAEIMGNLFRFHIEGTEAFDARNVDDASPFRQVVEGGKRGGVHTCAVGFGNFSCADVETGNEAVDQCAFPHSAVSGKEGDLSQHLCLEGFDARPLGGGDVEHLVSDMGVEQGQVVDGIPLFGTEVVGLVEDDDDGYAVGFGTGKEAVVVVEPSSFFSVLVVVLEEEPPPE